MSIYSKTVSVYKNLLIWQKLLLLFSIQIIIPIIFMGAMLYRKTENIIQDKSVTYAMDIIKMLELRVDDFDTIMRNTSQDLLYDQVLYDVLTSDEVDKFNFYQQVNELRVLLRRSCLSREEIQSVAIVSPEGEYYTYDSNSSRVIIQDKIDYKRMKEKIGSNKGLPAYYYEYDENNEVKNTYLIRLIYNIADFKEIGLFVILIKDNYLQTIYNEMSTGFMDRIEILNDRNEVLSAFNPIDQQALFPYLEMQYGASSGYYVDDEKQTMLAHVTSQQNRWTVVTQMSLKKLNKDLYAFKYWLVLLTISTLLILSVFTILMALDIIEPINRLVKGMKKIQEKNVHEEVLVDRKDELGFLSQAFNSMSGEIDFLLNQVYREQLTRKDAELKALQAQINPHFLFNTLESINWIAQLKKAPEISDMVTSLSTLMEASIGKGNPIINLKEEIKHADSYVLIMKNRYGDRLQYFKLIDESLLSVKLPKLSLQPIIENAIYHGIDKKRQGGTITIVIREELERCIVEVSDDGAGMRQEQIESINARFKYYQDDYLTANNTNGIGLVNVNHRIKLYCGEEYGLSISGEHGVGTKVSIILPK